jgi:hypothetical protein
MSNAQLAAIWNALPGMQPIAKFKDRKTAVQRFWAAFRQLSVASKPVVGAARPRAGSKQAQVIGLLQRPQGATIEEMARARARGWGSGRPTSRPPPTFFIPSMLRRYGRASAR